MICLFLVFFFFFRTYGYIHTSQLFGGKGGAGLRVEFYSGLSRGVGVIQHFCW